MKPKLFPANRIQYEDFLNPAQLEAVMTLQGPVLVIAGAGSGKTRTLVYRVARLVESGVPPEAILLLTFTRKAAQEMLDRAAGLADPGCRFVSGGTFHSLAHRVLRVHAERIGFSRGFAVLDRSDMEEVLHSLLPDLHLPKGLPRFPKRGTLASMLSKAANLEEPVEKCVLDEYGQFLEFVPQINRLEKLYADYKRTHQMMDYDDLILHFRSLLAAQEEVRGELSRQYTQVMVDEYQDTNRVQADIVRWLAADHRNVMAVGDDSQSIYSFRGADYRNMFDFPRQFPEVKIIKLEQNYRSTQPILTLTNAIMAQAREKYTKCLFTERGGGEPPKVVDTRSEPEQALFVCRQILERLHAGHSLQDQAVLFRAAYHSFELEAELTRQGIRYVKHGGFKFLESAHIKDFLACLRVVVFQDDAVSWIRVLRLVRNVGRSRSRAIMEWMGAAQVPAEQVGQWPGAGKAERELKSLGSLLAAVKARVKAPEQAVEQVMAFYLPRLKERYDDHPRRQKELEQLIPMAARYGGLRGFLDDLVLEPPSSSQDLETGEAGDLLTLSTVHSAKGLEWPVVYIIWAMEGRFPPARACQNPAALEEERRLMYVAATRAKDQLIVVYPGQEYLPAWGGYRNPGGGNGLSSFLQGLPPGVLVQASAGAWQGAEEVPAGRSAGGRASRLAGAGKKGSPGFGPGDRVRHPAFGAGVVSKFVDGDKVEVFFRSAGRKLLHLQYTTLEKT